MKKTYNATLLSLALVIFSACQKSGSFEDLAKQEELNNQNQNHDNHGWTSPATVLAWNEMAIQSFLNFPTPPPFPMYESRSLAMAQIAMHDALNNIKKKYQTYALHEPDKNADPDAAVAQAAYDVLIAETPWYLTQYNDLLASTLAAIPNGQSKTKGIALGHAAAAAILQKRLNDGSANAQTPYSEGTLPGEYRFTAPFDGPPFNGFYALPSWGAVKPFGLDHSSQFRPIPNYAVNSMAYTTDFNEVKSLGRFNSSTRTADQTHLALFWAEDSPIGWNRVARNIILQRGGRSIDAWKAARLMALVQIAEADAFIGGFEAKLYYNFWRPVSAIHLAATDGNPNTTADPGWEVLLFPTPPVPDYPSTHSVAGGAGAAVIMDFFGTDQISFTLTSTTNTGTRSFNSLSQAARENALSRIYIGYHFRNACMKGEQMGLRIGHYVFDHVLQAGGGQDD